MVLLIAITMSILAGIILSLYVTIILQILLPDSDRFFESPSRKELIWGAAFRTILVWLFTLGPALLLRMFTPETMTILPAAIAAAVTALGLNLFFWLERDPNLPAWLDRIIHPRR
jgi:hypothetical protein